MTHATPEEMPPGFRGIPSRAAHRDSRVIKALSVRAAAKAASVKAAAAGVVMAVTINDMGVIRGSATIRAAAVAKAAAEIEATTSREAIIRVAARAKTVVETRDHRLPIERKAEA